MHSEFSSEPTDIQYWLPERDHCIYEGPRDYGRNRRYSRVTVSSTYMIF